ncbi:hypothetical protein [Paraburkholderia sp. SG-MS1]|uniref:hypothetical protein n=1 Tax=Paraburkholderia sp. SG-MS1 TaxID=2023741 RepID=UPI001446162F|nr:hypothetical protein [Paraburkholderia sp. SG-MS1]
MKKNTHQTRTATGAFCWLEAAANRAPRCLPLLVAWSSVNVTLTSGINKARYSGQFPDWQEAEGKGDRHGGAFVLSARNSSPLIPGGAQMGARSTVHDLQAPAAQAWLEDVIKVSGAVSSSDFGFLLR